jgi:hypothetical protein
MVPVLSVFTLQTFNHGFGVINVKSITTGKYFTGGGFTFSSSIGKVVI